MNREDKKEILLIFHHGWAGDHSYFENFSSQLSKYFKFDSIFLDYGYFSENQDNYKHSILDIKYRIANYKFVIPITHSIGFLKMVEIFLNYKIDISCVVSFSGFVKFVNSDFDLQALNLTINKFAEHKIDYINSFTLKGYNYINYQLLMGDLLFLKDCNWVDNVLKIKKINQDFKFFNIYSKTDPILGSIKSINEQIGSNLFNEHIIQLSNSHFIPKNDTEECLLIVKEIIKNEII